MRRITVLRKVAAAEIADAEDEFHSFNLAREITVFHFVTFFPAMYGQGVVNPQASVASRPM
jgi:hypothetical protein